MAKKWKTTEKVIKKFQEKYKDKAATTLGAVLKDVDPQKIIAINESYDYPSILNDYKMGILKESVEKNGWTNERPDGIYLIELPNGDLLVGGMGNHRAVLAKELGIPSIKASVGLVKFL
ncbi:hypothetical protein [Paenibacillus borealis]|uniref:ParB/Sulfiredoxin domain-containing protein n=1 Tax=Paenibacillus borealis TaxID=160799 RepID=A0A089LDT2_PAEBO|nr:hypothetical protein [Paenibacillus borealis]AIQ59676.1 hypothetical protein PBOR_24000 [Paenibacillus borealis]